MATYPAALDARDVSHVDRSRFNRTYAAIVGVVTVITMVSGAIASKYDDDADTRASWVTDTIMVGVASLLFAAIAFALVVWALNGSRTRQGRTVIGLTVLAVLLVPVGWWSAAPVLVAIAAVLLGRTTGVASGPDSPAGPRVAAIIAALVAAGVFLFSTATTVIERF